MKKIFYLFFIFFTFNLSSLTVKEKFLQGEIGDYIVFDQNNYFYLLFIKNKDEKSLVLEEISAPKEKFLKKFSLNITTWHEWVKNYAPFHSSWNIYKIDIETGSLLQCYSQTKKAYVRFSSDDLVLLKLFSCELSKIPPSKRKKIGSPPANGESDQRPFWNPAFTYNGKLVKKTSFNVFEIQIEENIKNLKTVHLYFDSNNLCPFPFWIQIDEPMYTIMFKGIYCGKGIFSPTKSI